MHSWKALNPDWEYEEFDRAMALIFIYRNCDGEVFNAFVDAASPEVQSNIFRAAWCLKEGGVFADALTECTQSLDSLNLGPDLTLMKKWHGGLWDGFISTQADNPLVKKVLDKMVANLESGEETDPWKNSGPGVWISLLQKEKAVKVLEQKEISKFFKIEQPAKK